MARKKLAINEHPEMCDNIVMAINEFASNNTHIVSVRGPFMTTILNYFGSYRSEIIQPDMELIFKGVRLGLRKSFIFEFTPAAHATYKQVEFDEKKIFQAIPGMEQTLVNALGLYEEDKEITWSNAKNMFISAAIKKINDEAEALREMEVSKNLADESWGIF
jgi:hypothetical protein